MPKDAARSRTYTTWRDMIRRCSSDASPKEKKWYYDKGIRVCDEWFSFNNFLRDMGYRPQGYSIDRLDAEKGYDRSNCRWCPLAENLARAHKFNIRSCVQLKDGVEIARYPSCAEAGRANNLRGHDIAKCLRGFRATVGGYEWRPGDNL